VPLNNRHSEKNARADAPCPLCGNPGHYAYTGRDLLYGHPGDYPYHACRHCRAVFIVPMPEPEVIGSFYPDDYMVYEKNKGPKRYGWAEKSVLHHRYRYRHLSPPPPARALAPLLAAFLYRDSLHYVPDGRGLDIGCGNGRFIATMNSLGWRFEGVEFSPVAVRACREAGLTVFEGELADAAFDSESFDLITARHLLEHVPDPHRLFAEIGRVLKPGGRLLIQTPNSAALGRSLFKDLWYANDVPRHLILYDPGNLDMLAEHHGLRKSRGMLLTTPKIILNSLDYYWQNRGKPSRRRKLRRLLSRPYVWLAGLTGRGDEIFAVYTK